MNVTAAVQSKAADGRYVLHLSLVSPNARVVRFQYCDGKAAPHPKSWHVLTRGQLETNESLQADALAILSFVVGARA
jgi:hypothetical protein